LEPRLAKVIGARVHAKRLAAGLSQEQLGEHADIHRTYIGAVERGEKNVTVVTLAKIARALRCKLTDLLAGDVDAH
jgi:transcriptional regulator with XRE-family HTH domain